MRRSRRWRTAFPDWKFGPRSCSRRASARDASTFRNSSRLTATNAAKLYGLYPRKGTIAVGSDADLAIWDPEKEVTIQQSMIHDAMDYTPYEGKTIKGWPVMTLLRGEVVAEAGEFLGAAGQGQFLKCNISPATAPLGRRTIPFDPATGAAEPGRHGDHAH